MANKLLLKKKLQEFLEEDSSVQDITSEIISEGEEVKAHVIAKSSGYISGLREIKVLFDLLDIKISLLKNDGDKISKNDLIFELSGNAREILASERVCLNILTRMSAITSSTQDFLNVVKKLKKNTIIACTRKTTPGFRIFEKRAVKLGGGDTHRFGLDDMVLIKDTHRKYYAGDIKKILKKSQQLASFSKKIEIEVENVEDAIIAAKNGADIIMLDNMTPNKIEETIKKLETNNLRKNILLEASGGINRENIEEYIKSGVDIISLGVLTQFPHKQIDLSLEFE